MYALEIHNLRKTYDNGFEALKGIDLQVKHGDFFALLGANGAGKSTTIGLITSLLRKTSGQISIEGYDLDQQTEAAKSCLGLVPQEFNLSIFETCQQILLSQAGYYGLPRKLAVEKADALLESLGLSDKRHSQVRHLSGGMKRRLMIARGLIHSPKVLILDEPTAGVDIEIRHHMWEFLSETNRKGTTIILTTHYLEEAEFLCKNIAIIDKGQIIRHSSIKNLLKTQRSQSFILNTTEALSQCPTIEPFECSLIDPFSFELRVGNDWSLNQVFEKLTAHGIQVHSLRNKSNRLEALFLDLIKNGGA